MVVALSSLKKSRFIIFGVLICVVVLVHLEMQLAFLINSNKNDINNLRFLVEEFKRSSLERGAKNLSVFEDKVDELSKFSLKDNVKNSSFEGKVDEVKREDTAISKSSRKLCI